MNKLHVTHLNLSLMSNEATDVNLKNISLFLVCQEREASVAGHLPFICRGASAHPRPPGQVRDAERRELEVHRPLTASLQHQPQGTAVASDNDKKNPTKTPK